MQSNRSVVLGLIVTILAGVGLWSFAQGDPPAPPLSPSSEEPVAVAPAAGHLEGGTHSATEAAPAPESPGRVAIPAGTRTEAHLPALLGRVVGPDGRSIVGAKISAAPSLGSPDADGQLDPQALGFGSLEDLAAGSFDAGAALRSVRERLADRVEAETDSEGRFRIVAKGVSRGVGLRVLGRGHAVLDRRFERPREQDVDVGTLTLQAAAIVAGRVLTPDGAPIAGARVARVSQIERRLGGMEFDVPEIGSFEALRGGENAITDESGQFELAHVVPGELTLSARHPEHPTASSPPMTVEAGREVRSVLLTMQIGGVIAGLVQGLPADAKGLQVMAARKPKADGDAARPSEVAGVIGNLGVDLDAVLSEAGIGFGERTAKVGADGKFELRGLARETYRVWVARTGGGFAGSTVCSARVEAAPGSNVQLRFEPGVTVTFTVADAKSGAPVERMTVRDRLRGAGGVADLMGGMAGMGAMPSGRPASYPNGAVTVANLRPKANQKLTLTIEALGYATLERRDVVLPEAGNLDLGALQLDPVPVLEVTVVAADDGRPVQGARVRFNGDGNGAGRRGVERELRRFMPGNAGGFAGGRTDQDGRTTLNRPLRVAAIEVDAQGFAPFQSESITFSVEGPEGYTARLRVGGAVAVTVCDAADRPVVSALVEHRAPNGDVDSRKVDGQGIARFANLTPGAHQFRLGKEGGGFGRVLTRMGGRSGADVNGSAAPAADQQTWQPIEVADKATAALRLVKQPTATLRGIVRENGLPLVGARVTFREGSTTSGADARASALDGLAERLAGGAGGAGNRTPRTDQQGAYELLELPEGEHQLRISHESRSTPATVRVVLHGGENVFDVDLDVTLLRGMVKDSQGKPIDGARIRVRRPRSGGDAASEIGEALDSIAAGANVRGGGTIKTDATGAFEVRGVDPDVELAIQASAKGFAPAGVTVTARRGDMTAVPELVLVAAGNVRVSVAGNQPFGALRARWAGPGEGVAPVVGMLRGGKGTLEGLRPGPWEVSLESMEALATRFGRGRGQSGPPPQPAQQQKRTVEVIAGQTVDIDL